MAEIALDASSEGVDLTTAEVIGPDGYAFLLTELREARDKAGLRFSGVAIGAPSPGVGTLFATPCSGGLTLIEKPRRYRRVGAREFDKAPSLLAGWQARQTPA